MNALKTVPFAIALAFAAACGGTDGQDYFAGNRSDGGAANDWIVTGGGTVSAEPSRPSAVITGRVDGGALTSLRVSINGAAHDVPVAPDGTFVVGNVPSGDVTVGCDVNGHDASASVPGVQPGETIVIVVHTGGSVSVSVGDRTPSTAPPVECSSSSGAPLEIRGDHVVVFFGPGDFSRDVTVTGNDVTILGASPFCGAGHTSFSGTMTVRGDGCNVIDVELRGEVTIRGKRAHVLDACSGCYNDACSCAHRACGGDHGGDGHGNGHGDDDGKGDGDGNGGHGHGGGDGHGDGDDG